MSLKLQEYHSYCSLMSCKKITRKSTLECTLCRDEYKTRASRSNTGTTKTMQALCTFPSMRRLIITGTPIQNDLEEFYNVVNFVNPTVRSSVRACGVREYYSFENQRSNTHSIVTKTRTPNRYLEVRSCFETYMPNRSCEVEIFMHPKKIVISVRVVPRNSQT